MISAQPAIPLLVHEDCMEGVQLDIAKQQASLSKIVSNTGETATKLDDIELNTSSIKTSSSNTATATSSLNSAVGRTTDASTSNTVIGLLKSIANKL